MKMTDKKSIRSLSSRLQESILSILSCKEKESYDINYILEKINAAHKKSGLPKTNENSLYPAFKRMIEKGWITKKWDETGSKRLYSINNNGVHELKFLRNYRQIMASDLIQSLANTEIDTNEYPELPAFLENIKKLY